MKRASSFCILILILSILILLCQPVVNPADFTGQWYSSADQRSYWFKEGIIYCVQSPVWLSEEEYISGAYSFGGSSIYLFASGISGLEQGKQLYLIQEDKGSFLCESSDGSGKVYFIRYSQ